MAIDKSRNQTEDWDYSNIIETYSNNQEYLSLQIRQNLTGIKSPTSSSFQNKNM